MTDAALPGDQQHVAAPVIPDVDDDGGLPLLARLGIGLAIFVAFIGFLLVGANRPADPSLRPPEDGGRTVAEAEAAP